MSNRLKLLVTIGSFVAVFTLFAFAPRRDPTKVVAGMPCSVLSESEISSVIGAQMRLMPISGTICQYVATTSEAASVFVVARHDPRFPLGAEAVSAAGLGGVAERSGQTLYVRYGAQTYSFVVVPQQTSGDRAFGTELQLATKLHRTMMLARTR